MGWTSFKLDEPIKEWFRKQWECNSKYKVLDSALVKRNTMYGAIKNIETNEIINTFISIREAARLLKTSDTAIKHACCKSETHIYRNFKWELNKLL